MHKVCYEKRPDGRLALPKEQWTCTPCCISTPVTTAETPLQAEHPVATDGDAAADEAQDPTPPDATITLPFSSESDLCAATLEAGFVTRSSRKLVAGTSTTYYHCENKNCDAKASSRFEDPNWILLLPAQHDCKRPAIGVVDLQRGLSPAVLQHIRDLSASGSFSGPQIQEHVQFTNKITVSIDLIYRIGHNLREQLYGSGGDHGHLVRLQAERRVSLP